MAADTTRIASVEPSLRGSYPLPPNPSKIFESEQELMPILAVSTFLVNN